MNTFAKALKTLKTRSGRLDGPLLQEVLDGFMDGMMILTLQGELVQANDYAYQILGKFTQEESQDQLISQEIERICQAVIDSCELYPENPVIIEAEISNKKLGVLRIRARWLQLDDNAHPLIFVILEDQHRAIQSLVITESKRYGLTPREAEIWLLRRANRTYKEIATELFISLTTVKRHLKNIRAKLKRQIGDEPSEGSALILEGTEEGFRRIEYLFQSGKLTEIEGIPVKNVGSPYEAEEMRQNDVAGWRYDFA